MNNRNRNRNDNNGNNNGNWLCMKACQALSLLATAANFCINLVR